MARTVLAFAPNLAGSVMSGANSLDQAYAEAKRRKDAASGTEARIAALRERYSELADRVVEGELTLAGAEAEANARDAAERAAVALCGHPRLRYHGRLHAQQQCGRSDILWIIGTIGFGMGVLDVPVAPSVVGLILGPLAEQQFRRALQISEGDPSVFFTHPISAAILLIAALVIVPVIMKRHASSTNEPI